VDRADPAFADCLAHAFWQIAAADYGILPGHFGDEVIPFLERQYRQMFAKLELFDVAAEIERI
jgi:hypothetical protein